MKIQKIAVVLTIINLVLMSFLLGQLHPASAKQLNSPNPILRGSGLEIVDSTGKLRASISLQPAATVDGKMYPPAVVFRLINPNGSPAVKIAASSDGGGINLSDEHQGYVQILARVNGSYMKIKNQDVERLIKP